MSRDFIGALLQLNAEKGVSREQLVAHRRRGHPVGLSPRRAGQRGRQRQPGHRERQDARLARQDGRRRGRGPARRVHPRRGQEVQAGRTARRPGRDGGAGRLHLRSHPRPDGQAGGPASACAKPSARWSSASSRERDGEIITGTVSRVEPRGVILEMGKAEAILATTDQSATEHYRIGQHVKAFVLEVRRTTRGPADLRQPHPQELPAPPVRAGGSGDPRGHGRDQGHRARGRLPQQGRRGQPPGGPRSGRRDRRPARRPRPVRGRGAGRREDRHHPVERGPGRLRGQRAPARPRWSRWTSTRMPASPASPCPSGCSRWPSAARARTRAWRRS